MFLEKSAIDYDKNPKNLIHRSPHVVHKFTSFRTSAGQGIVNGELSYEKLPEVCENAAALLIADR